jgi:hypothetical protein
MCVRVRPLRRLLLCLRLGTVLALGVHISEQDFIRADVRATLNVGRLPTGHNAFKGLWRRSPARAHMIDARSARRKASGPASLTASTPTSFAAGAPSGMLASFQHRCQAIVRSLILYWCWPCRHQRHLAYLPCHQPDSLADRNEHCCHDRHWCLPAHELALDCAAAPD